MLETSARLLRLLSLLQTPREWGGAELAERLEVTPRTIRRDIDRLRELGYPIHATTGTAGGYRLGAGAAMPPLLLEDDEAVAVAIGLRTAAVGTVAGLAENALRALAKLEQVLPSRLRNRVATLQAITVTPTVSGPQVDPMALTVIAGTCRDHQRLRFDYADRDGTQSARDVEPHRLVHTGRRWYLVAWDVGRADWRTFRVDRVQPKIPLGPRFEPREPPDENSAAYAYWQVSPDQYRYRAVFLMHASAAIVTDRVSANSSLIEPVDDRTCLLETGSNSLDALAVHISLLDIDFEVREPPELIERIRVLTDRLRRSV